MKRFLAILMFAATAAAQTFTLNDTVQVSNTARPGLNQGSPSGASANVYKNLLAFQNPGFEPTLTQQVLQFQGTNVNATATTFQPDTNNWNFAGYDANQWTGATFTVIQGSYAQGASDPALGCQGTVTSSTNQSGAGPIFRVPACPGSPSPTLGLAGQIIFLSVNSSMSNVFPTPVSQWTGAAGFGISTSGGATITSETIDLCTACGTQAMAFTVPAGGSATLTIYPSLSNGAEKTLILNGTFAIAQMLKVAAGSPSMSISVGSRNGTVTVTPTLPSTWTQETNNATFSETASMATAIVPMNYTVSNPTGATAIVYLDNVSFSGSNSNPTVYSDAYNASFQQWCQSTQNTTGPACTARYGGFPNSETVQDWIQPAFTHRPSYSSTSALSTSFALAQTGLNDFLTWASYMGVAPVIPFPVTLTTADAANLVDFLQGSSSTTFGAKRAALGQTGPWVCATGCPFTQVILAFGNENWNSEFLGQAFGYNTSAPTNQLYYDYEQRAKVVIAAARAEQTAISASQTVTKWDLGLQTSSGGDSGALGIAKADMAEGNGYTGDYVYMTDNSGCSANNTCLRYTPTLTEPYSNTHDTSSSSGFRQMVTNIQAENTCGPTGNAQCQFMVYEENTGPGNGGTGLAYGTYTSGITATGSTNQTCILSAFNATGGTGATATVSLPLSTGMQLTWTNNGSGYTSGATSATVSSGTATCSGTATVVVQQPFNQSVSDSFVQAAIQGVIQAEQFGENDTAGVINQNLFQYAQYYEYEGGVFVHMWGAMLDSGGDCSSTNSSLFGGNYCPRPQMLGAQVYNSCKIGPMVQTTGSSIPTYNLTSSINGVNAISNVPLLSAYEFANGSKRCMVIVNKDIAAAHSLTFAGTNPPTTGVTTYQFAPSSITAVNEAGALNSTSTFAAQMHNVSGTGLPSSYPANSVTAVSWTVSGGTPANPPTYSPVAGTYTTPQTVSIATTTGGASIFYTNNGNTPDHLSTVYSSPLTISTSQTLNALASVVTLNNTGLQGASGWLECYIGSCAGGGTPGGSGTPSAVSMTQGVSSPSLSGASMHLSFTTSQSTTNVLWYRLNGTTCDTCQVYTYDLEVYPSLGFSQANAYEYDLYNFDATGNIFWTLGTQWNKANGTWDIWSQQTGWIHTSITTPLNGSQWNHLQFSGSLDLPTSTACSGFPCQHYYYLIINGTKYTLNLSEPAETLPSGDTSAMGLNVQVDGGSVSSSTVFDEYIDQVSTQGAQPDSTVSTAAYTIAPVAAAPTFLPIAGTYSSAQSVALSSTTAGVTFCYTTNGTTPSASVAGTCDAGSATYSGPITVSSSVTLNALATEAGYTNSTVSSAGYVISGGASNAAALGISAAGAVIH